MTGGASGVAVGPVEPDAPVEPSVPVEPDVPALIVSVRVVWALGPPSRLIVWPVKTWPVDVPAVSVSVSVAV
jgi:hypothetical protein